MSKGIVLFGINNSKVDYVQLAVMAAAFIKINMPGISICLITTGTSKSYYEINGKYKLDDYFEHVLLITQDLQFTNIRTYKDTQYYKTDALFKNEGRSSVYELSPYDETLLLDSDYLMCNNLLSSVWGSNQDVMINKSARTLLYEEMHLNDTRLNEFGIPMYWATAIYFKKGEKAKQLFELVDFIKDHWEYYKMIYDFPGSLFRNDYAFSIAIHILNGYVDISDYYPPLPDKTILTVSDIDQFYKIENFNTLMFFVNDSKNQHKYYLTKTRGLNIHCINKFSLLNNMDDIMEALNV